MRNVIITYCSLFHIIVKLDFSSISSNCFDLGQSLLPIRSWLKLSRILGFGNSNSSMADVRIKFLLFCCRMIATINAISTWYLKYTKDQSKPLFDCMRVCEESSGRGPHRPLNFLEIEVKQNYFLYKFVQICWQNIEDILQILGEEDSMAQSNKFAFPPSWRLSFHLLRSCNNPRKH